MLSRIVDSALLGCAVLSMLISAPLFAAEVPVDSRITAVTVYQGRATVTRSAQAEIAAGDHQLTFAELPAGLLQDSLRVKVQGSGHLTIGSLEARQVFRQTLVQEEERRLVAELQQVKDERRGYDDRIKALNEQLRFIQGLGNASTQTINEAIKAQQIDPLQWKKAWEAIGQGVSDTRREVLAAEQAMRALDERIRQLESQLQQVRTGRRDVTRVAVNVAAAQPGRATIELQYQVNDAWWQPVYEARLISESGATLIVQNAQVRQHSGESWNDVQLTVSTARPEENATAPELFPWYIDFQRPVLARQNMMEDALTLESAKSLAGAPEVGASAPAKEAEAILLSSEFSAEYRVPARVTLASDNQLHRFKLGEQQQSATLSVRSVPKWDTRAYLQANVKHSGAAPLLPGQVALFRDNVYVGQTFIDAVRPGEDLRLSFGQDDKVRIQYAIDQDLKSEQGIFDKQRRIERGYLITVENFHAKPMTVTILDQLPVARDEQIKVKLLDGSTKPTTVDVENHKGVLAWTRQYAPQEKADVRFRYSVTYPAERELEMF